VEISELNTLHFNIPDEAFCSSALHSKISIQFAIDCMKEVGQRMEIKDQDVKYITVLIRNKQFLYEKIKELNEYLNR
jgi:hypothetical protein